MSARTARDNGNDKADSVRAAAGGLDSAEFAEYLRAERERRRLTLDQVAGATKIAPHHLAALERGDVRHWPGGMYRRAMMRAYAESIGVDRELALKQFERAFELPRARQEQPPAAPAPSAAPPEPSAAAPDPSWQVVPRPRPRVPLVALAAIAGLAIGAGLWRLASGGAGADAGARTPFATAATSDAAARAAAPAAGRHAERAPAPRSTAAGAGAAPVAAAPRPAAAESRPAPAPVRRAATEGRIVVASQPAGARVTVNGIGWGETPVTIRYLPLGDKRVRLTMQGYISQERVVRLGPHSPEARLRVTLRRR